MTLHRPSRRQPILIISDVTSDKAPDKVPFPWTLFLPATPDNQDGFQAAAYLNHKTNQVVIAFKGPDSVPGLGWYFKNGAGETDTLIMEGKPNALGLQKLQAEAIAFAKSVLAKALREGLDRSDVFVTGNSGDIILN